MKQFIVAITGPTGAGKTTVGEKVAKKLDRCVNIDADSIKHMIVSGFFKDSSNPGGWGFNEWELVGDSIGLLAANFIEHNFSVVVNGYIDEPAWKAIETHVNIDKRVLLLPTVVVLKKRDTGRNSDIQMGEASIKDHHNTFSTRPFYSTFHKLDTSNHSVDETVDEVIKLVS